MRIRDLLLVLLAAVLIAGAVTLSGWRGTDTAAYPPRLDLGEQTWIDFGFQTVEDDFDAESQLTLENPNQRPLELREVLKSCSCYALRLSPERLIGPGEPMEVSFKHTGTTLGKGGYFHDKILLRFDGEGGDFAINYVGYVVRRSKLVPPVTEFLEVDADDLKQTIVTFVNVSRLVVAADGTPQLIPAHQVREVSCPPGVEAVVVEPPDGTPVDAYAPQVRITRALANRTPAGTRIRKLLQQLVSEHGELGPADLWQTIPVAFRLTSLPAEDMDDVATLVTDRGELPIPLRITLRPAFRVVPAQLLWDGSTEQIGRLRVQALTLENLDRLRSRASHDGIKVDEVARSGQEIQLDVTIESNRIGVAKEPLELHMNAGDHEFVVPIVRIDP